MIALDGLHPHVRRLWVARGFKEPTPPQAEAFPRILAGENVLIVAPTGTGKTEAAFLPILSMLLGEGSNGIKAVYVTPLRTLNRDILDRLKWWSLKLDLRIAVRHGDTSTSERRIQALKPPDILITTPETFQLLLVGGVLRQHLSALKWIIVDEVHEIADSKRGVQLTILLEKARRIAGREFQLIGLSATVGNPGEVAEFIVGSGRKCSVIYTPVSKMIEVDVIWPDEIFEDSALAEKLMVTREVASRLRYIKSALSKYRSILVFSNTRPTAEMIGSRLKLWDIDLPVHVHHGSLSQVERIRIEEMLREGSIKGVICTSSMELGIDIGYVDFVIQYNSPREVKRLIQRVGRSGHGIGRVSRGVVLVGDSDNALEAIVLVNLLKREQVEPSKYPPKPLDVLAHEIIGFAVSGKYTLDEVYELVKKAVPYRDLDRDEFNVLVEFLSSIGLLSVIGGYVRPAGKRTYDYFFKTLSMIPEVRQYYVVDREEKIVVGLLDDFFVSEYCEPGARFIMAGRPWEVLSLTEKTVYVKPVEDYRSAIPSWIGEEIPVSYDVAQEVGRIRGLVEEMAKSGLSLSEVVETLSAKYGANEDTLRKAILNVYYMVSKGTPVPTDRRIIVEDAGDNIIIVHAHFGNKVNRVLGKYLSHTLAGILGIPVYVAEKPYRIILRAEGLCSEDVEYVLRDLTVEEFKKKVYRAVEESRGFRWRLQQVARRMGVIEPEKTLSRADLENLVLYLKDTPPYLEALKEVLYKDMDMERALSVVEMLEREEVEVKSIRGPTKLTLEYFKFLGGYMEPRLPEKRDIISHIIFKTRILSNIISLGCLDCGNVWSIQVSKLLGGIECPVCFSKNIAFDVIGEEELSSRIRRCRSRKRGKGCRILWDSVRMLREHGVAAVLARAAGFSFREIRRIALHYSGDVDSFLKKLWVEKKRKMQEAILSRLSEA